MQDLLQSAHSGDARSIARFLSLIEDHPEQAPLLPALGRALVIGVTGAPGVGKSTLTAELIGHFRSERKRVAVVAVDPTSPFSGGALLGDRIRMQSFALDEGVFIRSMATRGHLGGLAAAVPHALRFLDSIGFDVVIVETVGVGQSEVEIAAHADTTLVVLAPGMGDAVQAAKAGLLEIGDIYIVNKSDREGAEQTAKEIRDAIALGLARGPEDWRQRVLLASAERSQGIAEIARAIEEHRAWLTERGLLHQQWRNRSIMEIEQAVLRSVREELSEQIDAIADRVVAGEVGVEQAAKEVLGRL